MHFVIEMVTEMVISTDGGQSEKAVAFGREGFGSESSCRWSASPVNRSLSVAVPFLENAVYCYFITKGIKKIKYILT